MITALDQDMPPNHILLAILSTVFCICPCGMLSLFHAVQVHLSSQARIPRGDHNKAVLKRFPDRENYRDCRNTITKDGFLCLKNCLTTRQCKWSNNKKRKTGLTLFFSLYKDIVFPTQTKYYPYFSTDFKLRTFLRIQTSGKVKAGSCQPLPPL